MLAYLLKGLRKIFKIHMIRSALADRIIVIINRFRNHLNCIILFFGSLLGRYPSIILSSCPCCYIHPSIILYPFALAACGDSKESSGLPFRRNMCRIEY